MFGCLAIRVIRLIKTISYAVHLFSQHFWFLAASFDATKKKKKKKNLHTVPISPLFDF